MIERVHEIGFTPDNWFYPGQEPRWARLLDGDYNILISDGNGSYGLLCHIMDHICEGHIFIDPKERHRSQMIGEAMVDWCWGNLSYGAMMAKTKERHTLMFLRRIGFKYYESADDYSYCMVFRPSV